MTAAPWLDTLRTVRAAIAAETEHCPVCGGPLPCDSCLIELRCDGES